MDKIKAYFLEEGLLRSIVLNHHKVWKIIFEYLEQENIDLDFETLELVMIAAVA